METSGPALTGKPAFAQAQSEEQRPNKRAFLADVTGAMTIRKTFLNQKLTLEKLPPRRLVPWR